MSMTDEVWVGPNPPTDPLADLWFDTDAVGTIPPPGGGGGTGGPPYDDTQVKADIATNTADIAAVAQASLQGDAGLDVRVATLENAGGSGYDDTQIKADLAQEVTDRTDGDSALAAQIAAIPAPTPPYDDTAITGRVVANEQAIAAIPAPYDDTALTASVTANTQAIAALPAPTPHWFGAQADYDQIAAPDPAGVFFITS